MNTEPLLKLNRIDLNLLVYLDALLRERNVTQAAHQLNLSQPAMSNGLRRLRELFDDPLLVRTSEGMTPTERALELEPIVREVLTSIDRAVQPRSEFDARNAHRVFRIMASDYAESTLFPSVLGKLKATEPRTYAPAAGVGASERSTIPKSTFCIFATSRPINSPARVILNVMRLMISDSSPRSASGASLIAVSTTPGPLMPTLTTTSPSLTP